MNRLINNNRTDKNTIHSYIPLYETLFKQKKETAKHILEIGILGGGSIDLWYIYFTNATIYGVDIMPSHAVWDGITNKKNIILYTATDAYDSEFVDTLSDIKFDIILDDGPHSLFSQQQFIKLYSPLLADDGILVIEDVQSIDWVDTLRQSVPYHLKQYIKVYDLRDKKGRYDDIVFTIDKNN